MTYMKPEVMVLGSAKNVIELNGVQKQLGNPDGTGPHIAPAYDLDE
ncbi:MAG TPA: hypothetical protein VNO32_53380 [Candidatus Acidoferrum sp.]|nr:hypothetical protein [Candidatus Acidoferrum sp.]